MNEIWKGICPDFIHFLTVPDLPVCGSDGAGGTHRPGMSSSGHAQHSDPKETWSGQEGSEARAEMVEGQSWAISRNP